MKRVYAFAIGLVMFVAPMATAAGIAAADPYPRTNDYQQLADTVIARGLSQRGVPFSWAGGGVSGPTRGTGSGINTVGFDASGLVQYAYAGAGLKLPRSSGQMYRVGERVLPQQARKADLIFYGPEGTQSVAMYLGNGQMLEVGDVVQVSPVRSSGMTPYLVRILGTNSLQTGPVQPAPQAPAQTVPGQQAPAQTVPGQQAPAQTIPGQQAPAQTIPGQQAPAQTIPGQQAPAQTVPGQQAPTQTIPGQQAPLQQAPVQQLPAQQAPLQQQSAPQVPLQQVIPQPPAPLVPTPQPPLQLVPTQPAPAATAPR
jgi:hypothetical protein